MTRLPQRGIDVAHALDELRQPLVVDEAPHEEDEPPVPLTQLARPRARRRRHEVARPGDPERNDRALVRERRQDLRIANVILRRNHDSTTSLQDRATNGPIERLQRLLANDVGMVGDDDRHPARQRGHRRLGERIRHVQVHEVERPVEPAKRGRQERRERLREQLAERRRTEHPHAAHDLVGAPTARTKSRAPSPDRPPPAGPRRGPGGPSPCRRGWGRSGRRPGGSSSERPMITRRQTTAGWRSGNLPNAVRRTMWHGRYS